MQQAISVIGLGWLGEPLAIELQRRGYRVLGSTTSPDKQKRLQATGIETYLLSLDPEPRGTLDPLLRADILLVNVPPKAARFGAHFHPAQMRHLAGAVKNSPVKRIIYISSTSVYPELSRMVTEADVQTPDQSASPALVEAEQTWLALTKEGRDVTVLRCGGLMGYERRAGKYVDGKTVDSGGVPVNYIHRDDAVCLISDVIRLKLTGTYNVVSPKHPSREAVYRHSCEKYGYDLPTFVEPAEPLPYKIVSSEKLLTQTNYHFRYESPLDFP